MRGTLFFLCMAMIALSSACGDASLQTAHGSVTSQEPLADLDVCTSRWDAIRIYNKGDQVSSFFGIVEGNPQGRVYTALRYTFGEAPGATLAWEWNGTACSW